MAWWDSLFVERSTLLGSKSDELVDEVWAVASPAIREVNTTAKPADNILMRELAIGCAQVGRLRLKTIGGRESSREHGDLCMQNNERG